MWKDIKGYEGLYQVSDHGEIRRLKKDGTAKPVKCRQGGSQYLTVSLSKNSIYKSYNVHRLVAEAFLEREEGKTEVNHKDGNKYNNELSNLEWVTVRENRLHAMEVLKAFPYGKPARKVRAIDVFTNETVAEFPSISDAARALEIPNARGAITKVCRNYDGQKTAYGYKWEYID